MTCPLDEASDQEQRHRDAAVVAKLAEIAAQSSGMAFTHCVDCNEEISQARRQVVRNCRRCVDCEEAKSQHNKWLNRSTGKAYR